MLGHITHQEIVMRALEENGGDYALATLQVGQQIVDLAQAAFVIVEEIQHLTEVCLFRCDETGGLPASFLDDALTAEQMVSAANFVDLVLINQMEIEEKAIELKMTTRHIHAHTRAANEMADKTLSTPETTE